MAENNQPSEEEIREKARRFNKELVEDSAARKFFIASRGRNTEDYGKAGLYATTNEYIDALTNPSAYAAKILAQPFLDGAREAQEAAEEGGEVADVYGHTRNITAHKLLETAERVYMSSFLALKVGDVLDITQTKGKDVSRELKDKYIEDLDNKLKKQIVGNALQIIATEGIGEAIKRGADQSRKSLEQALAPKENSE